MENRTYNYPYIKFNDENPKTEIISTSIDFTNPDSVSKKILIEPLDITEKIHPVWINFFRSCEMCKGINTRLKNLYVYGYKNNFDVYPFPQDVLNFMQRDPTGVKCCIVGQDPYPGFDQEMKKPVANGFAFATYSQQIPMSQLAIRNVIASKFGQISTKNEKYPFSLEGWMDQGVFLMNKTPVVYIGPNHMDSKKNEAENMWASETVKICQFIDANNPGCQFILFGNKAAELSLSVKRPIVSVHMSGKSDRSKEFNSSCFEQVASIEWNKF